MSEITELPGADKPTPKSRKPIPEHVPLPASLEAMAAAGGVRWAGRVIAGMRDDHRRVCGGWPGTMSEALAVTLDELLPTLSATARGEVERLGAQHVARVVYQSARRHWLTREAPEPRKRRS